MINLLALYEKNIPLCIRKALKICAEAADTKGLKLFLIGGAVRDLILGMEVFDTDITVEGDAVEFSRYISVFSPDKCLLKETHESFKTAKVVITIDGETVELDIASTRKEIYEKPASLPTVVEIGCNIEEDISRRDFTVNSMAMSLNEEDFCTLVDPLGGYFDLKNRVIRILHPKSFIDDPTRIIRALKFRVRFGLIPDVDTARLQKECIDSKLFDGLCGERIKSELRQTFNLNNFDSMKIFFTESICRLVSPELEKFDFEDSFFSLLRDNIYKYKDFFSSENVWLVVLASFLSRLSQLEIVDICRKLYLSKKETEIVVGVSRLLFDEKNRDLSSRYVIYKRLNEFSLETLVSASVYSYFDSVIDLYINELKNVKIQLTGNDLIKMGFSPSPMFSLIFEEVLKTRLNEQLSGLDEEMEVAKKYLNISS